MWSWIRALVLLGSGFPSMEFYGIGRKLPSDTNWNEIFFQKIPNTNQSSSYYGSSMRVYMIYIWYTYDICVQSCHAMRRDASFKAVYIMYVMYVMYVVWRDMTWCDVYIHICLRIRIWRFSSFVSSQKKKQPVLPPGQTDGQTLSRRGFTTQLLQTKSKNQESSWIDKILLRN